MHRIPLLMRRPRSLAQQEYREHHAMSVGVQSPVVCLRLSLDLTNKARGCGELLASIATRFPVWSPLESFHVSTKGEMLVKCGNLTSAATWKTALACPRPPEISWRGMFDVGCGVPEY